MANKMKKTNKTQKKSKITHKHPAISSGLNKYGGDSLSPENGAVIVSARTEIPLLESIKSGDESGWIWNSVTENFGPGLWETYECISVKVTIQMPPATLLANIADYSNSSAGIHFISIYAQPNTALNAEGYSVLEMPVEGEALFAKTIPIRCNGKSVTFSFKRNVNVQRFPAGTGALSELFRYRIFEYDNPGQSLPSTSFWYGMKFKCSLDLEYMVPIPNFDSINISQFATDNNQMDSRAGEPDTVSSTIPTVYTCFQFLKYIVMPLLSGINSFNKRKQTQNRRIEYKGTSSKTRTSASSRVDENDGLIVQQGTTIVNGTDHTNITSNE